jgi:hypothetical protein
MSPMSHYLRFTAVLFLVLANIFMSSKFHFFLVTRIGLTVFELRARTDRQTDKQTNRPLCSFFFFLLFIDCMQLALLAFVLCAYCVTASAPGKVGQPESFYVNKGLTYLLSQMQTLSLPGSMIKVFSYLGQGA